MTLTLTLAVKNIAWLNSEAKKADEQLWKTLEELKEIALHPIKFIEIIGQNSWKGVVKDWNDLKYRALNPSISNDFEAGRIIGRALYQVIMMILLVMSVAGVTVKLAARFPWLMRLARIISRGGKLEELEEAEQGVRAAKEARDAAETARKLRPPPRDGLRLHNKKWAEVRIKDGTFTPEPPQGPIELDNPSSIEQRDAIDELRRQGRSRKTIEQIMDSGRDPEIVHLDKGEKLYGFTTQGKGKLATSPYWMTQDEFSAVKSQYCSDGVWDRQGVKDYLALPCFNRADALVSADVTQDADALSTTINPAKETTFYTDEFGKRWIVPDNLMPGGGPQVTPPPSVVGNIQEVPLP
jgi:hypothetical protein